MSVCSVSESPEQPRCEFCDKAISPGGRRPRRFCDDACRMAARREEAKERTAAGKAPGAHPAEQNGSTAKSVKSVKKISSEINGLISEQNGSSTPSLPLDIFGRGRRWPGAKANGDVVRIAAAVDAELGAGADWQTSPGGARYQIVPRRAR